HRVQRFISNVSLITITGRTPVTNSTTTLALPLRMSCPQSPVQAWKVPGGDSRVLTTQVSFNRKSPFLLASSQVNQVYIWDLRK
ncbi:unnamed protein product, partial [Hapterophycus canaliculatus]